MAENSQASPAPLPVETAAEFWTNRVMALHRRRLDPESDLQTDDALRSMVQADMVSACTVERERGSRPARRRFLYAERHGHRINVFHPPVDGPQMTPEQEQIYRLQGRLKDANVTIVRLMDSTVSAAESIDDANAASRVARLKCNHLSRLLLWHRAALVVASAAALVYWLI